METLSFVPGDAFLPSDSMVSPWSVVFEDEGIAGYFYACDRTRLTLKGDQEKAILSEGNSDEAILDAMLIYNVEALRRSDAELKRPEPERIAAVEWSKDGMRAVLYLDGAAQGMYDFATRDGFCRMDFPNFITEQGETWKKASHAWNESRLREFEAELFSGAEA